MKTDAPLSKDSMSFPQHKDLLDAGYAPGTYMFKCMDCGCEAIGDKRARRCRPCAEKRVMPDKCDIPSNEVSYCPCGHVNDGDQHACYIVHVRLKDQIQRLTKALRIAELKASGTLANNLCPDHRDKQTGRPCLACEIERLTQERDEWAQKWHKVRAELAELKYPGMKGVVRPMGTPDATPAVPLGSEPWRVSLPIITVQMLGDYGQEGFFEKTDQPVRGVAGVSWSQAAVDFACMLQGERQRAAVETTALPSAETYDSAREFAAELSRHTGGDPRRVSETVCETMRDALEGTSPRPWRNGDTWHCQCGAASTAETCTNPNCRRRRADEWGDVPAVEMSVAHSKSQQKRFDATAKRAYYETHEPPHCPTCECGAEKTTGRPAVAAVPPDSILPTED